MVVVINMENDIAKDFIKGVSMNEKHKHLIVNTNQEFKKITEGWYKVRITDFVIKVDDGGVKDNLYGEPYMSNFAYKDNSFKGETKGNKKNPDKNSFAMWRVEYKIEEGELFGGRLVADYFLRDHDKEQVVEIANSKLSKLGVAVIDDGVLAEMIDPNDIFNYFESNPQMIEGRRLKVLIKPQKDNPDYVSVVDYADYKEMTVEVKADEEIPF